MWSGGKNFGATKNDQPKIKISEEEETRFEAIGLNNGLKPIFGLKTANHGSENFE